MDKSRVIETLRVHRDELRAAGVVHLSVFGSVEEVALKAIEGS